ncbi:uncharacterized protein LOC111331120 isoform X2 [Stylophora pistillata]|nr:uncharacterized protein LOC111331120 isoform X2 [Stylophora pistillata]XP_022791902.1 uncharacterized protein LOC111331120 isoform X2 [Stylophora pistillata]
MFQNYEGAISEGQKEHKTEVEFCKRAHLAVTVGHKLNESFHSALRHCEREIFNLIPGILEEFVNKSEKVRDSKNFEILVFGRGDTKDFELKGLHIAAEAVAHLNEHDPTYILKVVGAPEGEQEKLAEKLKGHKISPSQLRVRSFYKERRKLAELFLEVDLVLMPSGTEGFGLTALEALSAGVPILITNNSGLAEALNELPLGDSCIVNSEADWADKIKQARKRLKTRLREANILRDEYKKEYCWRNQCAGFVEKLRTLHSGFAEEVQRDSQDKRCSAQKQEAVTDLEKGRENEDGPKAKKRQGAISKQDPSTSKKSEESIKLIPRAPHSPEVKQDDKGSGSAKKRKRKTPLVSRSSRTKRVKKVNFEDSVPNDDVLEELAHKIGNKWKQLGRRLGFEDDAQLAQIDQAPGLELSQKALRMLKEWKQQKGPKAINKILYEALSHKFVGRTDLAEYYCTEKNSF